jgi:hypothetical protein
VSDTKTAVRDEPARAPHKPKRKAPAGKTVRVGKLELMNRETGEVIPVEVRRRPDRVAGRFFMVIQEGLELLAIHDDLTHDARRVMLFLLARMDFDNHIRLSQTVIASELGIDKSRVSRAVKLLVECRLIRPGERIGRATFYVLSSAIGWKGKPGDRAEMGAERARARLKGRRRLQADERARRRRERAGGGPEVGERGAPPGSKE